MDANLKAKWVTALRSGKYLQTQGSLYKENKYCCLGVLCEVMGLPRDWEDGSYYYYSTQYHWERSDTSVPEPVLPMEEQNRLIRLNDEEGCTFSEIADWIEANL